MLAFLTYVCTSELQEVYLYSRSHNPFEAEKKVKKQNKTLVLYGPFIRQAACQQAFHEISLFWPGGHHDPRKYRKSEESEAPASTVGGLEGKVIQECLLLLCASLFQYARSPTERELLVRPVSFISYK